jgi:hypothetical protein
MSFVEKVEQWNREIAGSFDRAFSDLRRQLQERVRESHQDLDRRIEAFAPPLPVLAHQDLAPAADHLRGEARAGALGELRDVLAALDRARSQSAVLAALIAGTAPFASRAALLLSRGGELRGWGGQGFGDAEHRLPDLTLTPRAGSPWGAAGAAGAAGEHSASGPVQLSAAECAVLCGRIESPVPAYGVLVPLVLRDRTVAVLYADQLPVTPETPEQGDAAPGQASALSLPALQSLVYVAALAIESLPFRQRETTATLQPAPAAGKVGEAGETGRPAAGAGEAIAAARARVVEGVEGVAGAVAAEPAGTPAVAAAPAAPAAAPVEEPAAKESASEEPAAAPGTAAGTSAAAAPASVEPPVVPDTSGAAEISSPAAPAVAPGTPFAVTPATLYDAPRVPVLKETAEIPTRPLRPVPPLSPAAAASIPRGAESPYLDEAAASGGATATTAIVPGIGAAATAATDAAAPDAAATASAAAPAGAGEHETVLLPRTGLRDAAGSPWGRGRGAEAAPAPGGGEGAQGLAGVPEAPETRETPEAPETPQIREAPSPITPIPSVAPDTQATAAAPHGPAGLGTLRAVPSVPPLAAAGPGSAASTVGTNPGTILPPPALTPVPPAPPASPFFEPLRTGPLGSGTPEVRPPSGVQGPGWAFATTRIQASSSEDAMHEEARRLARLLVSEIKLYNEEQVEAGRRNRDIYERLREDIDRSRQMYEERVDPRLVKSTDYFYQELVRILAAGDSKALGI